MNVSKYTESELNLMSYQELRKISILLQLPANIKKKYMVSMIQAHQKGDGWTKIAIANKIMEERKIKRLSNKAKLESTLETRTTAEQVPTDLSVSTKHEFETRFSYVAHYTSKDNMNSGISRIIKQKAEVSRRNRSFLQQTRKTTRKLPSVGRTEIMLPRNHSLTTPVRLMPQNERGFVPPTQYENTASISNLRSHFQDNAYNYHFHGEYTNSLAPTSSNEMYREESYWPSREVYNNSLMPILSSLLTPNPATINSSAYTSQFTSQSVIKGSSSFQQGVYEKYIKSGGVLENPGYQPSIASPSTLIANNHFSNDDNNNNCNLSHGCRGYLVTKNDVEFELNSPGEIDCKQYSRRDENFIRNGNNIQAYNSDFYGPRTGSGIISHSPHLQNYPECTEDWVHRMSTKNTTAVQTLYRPFETSPVTPHESVDVVGKEKDNVNLPVVALSNYESVYVEDRFWNDVNRGKKLTKSKVEKESFGDGTQTLLSEISENSTDFSGETDLSDPLGTTGSKDFNSSPVNFTRCRFVQGHNKFPEVTSKTSETISSLPSFLSAFCANGLYNNAYSVCRNSFTGTTETHLNPIMTCTYASQYNSHSNPQHIVNNNSNAAPVIQRQWLYSYPESQAPFAVESTTYTSWDEYSDDMGNKVVTHNNNHEVQLVKCRKHGCHYVYSVSNPCE